MSAQLEFDYKRSKWLVTTTTRYTSVMKSIPGSRALPKKEPGVTQWYLPPTLGAYHQLKKAVPDLDDTRARSVQVKMADERTRVQRLREVDEFYGLAGHQAQGAAWLSATNGLLADPMGSGKTVMACVAAAWYGPGTMLVLTTTSTLGVWAKHLLEWTSIKPFIFHGPKREAVYQEYLDYKWTKALISTHALARSHSRLASYYHVAAEGEPGYFNEPFDLCVIDECHKMGIDPKNKGVRAMHAIGENCYRRWALTGTPVNDKPDDLWVIMRFVEPDLFGDRKSFRDRYCIMRDNGYTLVNLGLHPDREREFRWVLDPYFLRRPKELILPDLPTQHEPEIIELPLEGKQGTLYRSLLKEGMALLPSGDAIVATDVLELSQVLSYAASATPEVDDEGRTVALTTPSNKLTYLLDVAEDRAGDPFVVFAYSARLVRFLAEQLEAKGYRVATITGQTKAEDRTLLVDLFQQGGLACLLITEAAAEGVTLTAADLIVFAQESWRASTNQQAMDRIHRWGQDRPCRTQILVSKGTVDESRRTAVTYKTDMQQQILRDKAAVKRLMTGDWSPDD